MLINKPILVKISNHFLEQNTNIIQEKNKILDLKKRLFCKVKFKACALLFFDNINNAANTIKEFAKVDFISSAEIMDYASLKAA
ncbi:hypothetical protein VWO34_09635, partial [Campylobacter coli]